MTTREAIANRIVDLCKERGITLNALAYASGVATSTVMSIIYNRSKNPGVITLKKLCDGLGISLTEFFDADVFRGLEQELR